jgi:hypothetical protein
MRASITTGRSFLNSAKVWGWLPMMQMQLRKVKEEHAVILWPDTPPEAPFYEDCNEALAVVELAGGGFVVSRAVYETPWMEHDAFHTA